MFLEWFIELCDKIIVSAQFTYNPAEDENVDPKWELIANENITVQDTTAYGGRYVVNQLEGMCSINHGDFRSKIDAFAKAISVNN
jgi:hypothetical protein